MLSKLIKVRFQVMLGSMFGKKKGASRLNVGMILAIGFLAVCFAVMSGSVGALMASVMVENGLDSIYFAMFNLVTFLVVFTFSIFETKSQLFECHDNELLLSMPVPSRYIVLSRVLSVLVMNIAESAVVMLPVIVIYAVFGGSAVYIVGSILSMLLITLLATALACGVGYLVAMISSFFKNRSLLTVLLYVIFFAAYFVLYGKFVDFMGQLGDDPENVTAGLESAFGGMRFLGEISCISSPMFYVLLGVTAVVSALCYLIISRHYVSIITRTGKGKTVKYREKTLNSGSAFSAMFKKEMSRFFSCPTYIMNSLSGGLLMVIFTVYLFIDSAYLTENLKTAFSWMGIDPVYGSALAMACLIFLMSSFNMASASALSLEGNNLWILKTSPISSLTVLHAKLMPQLCTSLPISIIASVCIGIVLGLEPVPFVIAVAVAVLANILFALTGLTVNVLMPKFDFENISDVVKRSGAATLAMFGGMISSVLIAGGAFALCVAVGAFTALLILFAFILVLCVALYFVLTGPIRRKLERIEP